MNVPTGPHREGAPVAPVYVKGKGGGSIGGGGTGMKEDRYEWKHPQVATNLNKNIDNASRILQLKPKEARSEYIVDKSAMQSHAFERHDHQSREAFQRLPDFARTEGRSTVAMVRGGDNHWNYIDPRAAHGTIGGGSSRDMVNGFDVDINRHHVHGPHCGHFQYSGGWHDFPQHHVHGPGCGHFFYDAGWHEFAHGHVHGPGCGHFFENNTWISYCGGYHQHHPGCGHYFWGGFWHNYAPYHVHYNGCGHFFYTGCWHDFPEAHVHSDGCGHLYDGVAWFVTGYPEHVHYSGCGHYYYDNFWHAYPQTYYNRCRPRSFYFFTDLGGYEDRSVPTYVSSYQQQYPEPDPVNVYEAQDPLSEAYSAFARQDYYQSVVSFNDAVQQHGDDGLLYFARAQSYFAVADYASAYSDIVYGMGLIPDWGQVRFNMTELYNDPEEFTRQLRALEGWVSEHPNDFHAHFVLGYVYYFIQEYDLAKSELVYTLAYAPEHPQARRLLDQIYERQSEPATAYDDGQSSAS